MSRQWCRKNSIDLSWILQIGLEIFFFSSKFFSQSDFENNWNSVIRLFCHWNREMSEHWCWKYSICLCWILQIGEKKIFLLSKFFIQSDFEKKPNSVIRLLSHWNREMSEHWCWKNSIELRCIHEIRAKKFFFLKFFQTVRIREKNQIQLFDFFLIGIKRSVNSDAERILLTFVVFSKSARKNFFFIKIFLPMRFREKIKFNYSIFLSL